MKRAADILTRLLDEQNRDQAQSYDSAFRGWRDLAGISLAEHSRVYEIKYHNLFVEVDHNGWMQILMLRKRRILNKLRRILPELEIRDIKVRINPALALEIASYSEPEMPIPSTGDRRAGQREPDSHPEPAADGQGIAGAVAAQSPAAATPDSQGGVTAADPGAASVPPDVSPAAEEVERIVAAVGQEPLKRQLRRLFLSSLEDQASRAGEKTPEPHHPEA
jgi:hypothetical protein